MDVESETLRMKTSTGQNGEARQLNGRDPQWRARPPLSTGGAGPARPAAMTGPVTA